MILGVAQSGTTGVYPRCAVRAVRSLAVQENGWSGPQAGGHERCKAKEAPSSEAHQDLVAQQGRALPHWVKDLIAHYTPKQRRS